MKNDIREREIERLIIEVTRGQGRTLAYYLARTYGDVTTAILYEEDRYGMDIVEVWAEYLTAQIETFLLADENTNILHFRRYSLHLLEQEQEQE